MSENNTEFIKYQQRGPYHWEQISWHPLKSNAFVKARYGKCLQLLKTKVQQLSGKRIIDIGCGDGVFSYLLYRQGAHVLGIDNSEMAIEYARQKHLELGTNCEFKRTNCEHSGLPDDFFECAICTDVIEHVSDPAALLAEIKRILKPGGVGLISTPIRFTHQPLDKMHVTEWFPDDFLDLVSQVFSCCEFHKTTPVFWMEFFNRSIFNRILINMTSSIYNPFVMHSSRWRYYAMQYAIIEKKR